MIPRALGCAVNVALYVVVATILAIALGLLFGQLQLRSTPRSEPQPAEIPAGHASGQQEADGTAAAQSGASKRLMTGQMAGPVGTTAITGAPSPTASWGLGAPHRHRTGLAAAIRQPGATPRPSPRPSAAPPAPRAGTAGGSSCDGLGSPVAFNGLHPIAESWWTGTAAGIASHMGDRFPASYLALPIGPGYFVRIVGAGGHVEMCSTDAGPDLQRQREGRVADLSVAVFVKVCGVPASLGLCQVSVSVLGRKR